MLLAVFSLVFEISIISKASNPEPGIAKAADSAPSPENAVTPAGWDIFWGLFIYNGISAQPSDKNVVQSATTTINFTSTSKDAWFFGYPNKINSVSVREYVGGKWVDAASVADLTKKEPYADVAVNFTNLSVGTHYYQISVSYGNNTKAYSRVVTVNVLPQPVDAISLNPKPVRSTLFWGETTGINSNIQPSNSTTMVNWALDNTNLGTFSSSTGIQNNFTTTLQPTDANLKQASGLKAGITTTAQNPSGSIVSGSTSVTIGGLLPQKTTEGDTFAYYPAILDEVQYPASAQVGYSWQIFDANYKLLSNPGGKTTLNTKTFNWEKVPLPSSGIYYLKLNITLTQSGQTTTWQSNYTPLTVDPAVVKLIAVPNLLFNKFDGTNYTTPNIQDFYNPAGLTLNYVPKGNVKASSNYDGNNNDLLAVSGKKWTLTVGFSPFRNTDNQKYLTTATGGAAQFNLNVNGQNFAASDNSTPVTLFTNSANSYTGNLTNSTTLKIPQVKTVTPGTYQSTATWTLIKAP
ncbi:extracellular protein [Agrilactobacillus composti DSM 18527 = JCM 14202]|uniref:Extracellular protein n=1 Tax=Agrilactobacillus composti DSM 18527 = JCM 14202 TaxID=1423734 RepID=A0A0R1Y6K1_9LACO|nr:extracellular protein [Agrilactobacillus composti DSM 18527 = JCM 14202]